MASYEATHNEPQGDSDRFLRQCLRCFRSESHKLKMRKCAGCQEAYYCSVECQKADWSKHKGPCKARKAMPPEQRAAEKALERYARAHRLAFSRAAAHALGLHESVDRCKTFYFAVHLRSRKDKAPAKAFHLERAEPARYDASMLGRSLKRGYDNVEEQWRTQDTTQNLLGCYSILFMDEKMDTFWDPISFAQIDVDLLERNFDWKAFLFQEITGAAEPPKQTTVDLVDELQKISLKHGPDLLAASASTDCMLQLAPCCPPPDRPHSFTDSQVLITRVCAKCDKNEKQASFIGCACGQVGYCSKQCEGAHRSSHQKVCTSSARLAPEDSAEECTLRVRDFARQHGPMLNAITAFALRLGDAAGRARSGQEAVVVHLRRVDRADGRVSFRMIDAHLRPFAALSPSLRRMHEEEQRTLPTGHLLAYMLLFDHVAGASWVMHQEYSPKSLLAPDFTRMSRSQISWKALLFTELGFGDADPSQ